MRKVWALVAFSAVVVWPVVRAVLLLAFSWVLWRASIGVMVPTPLPASFTQPSFLPYLSFWILVAMIISTVRDLWRGK